MHTNSNPLFASIRVHSWFIKALVPTTNRRECTRTRTPYSLPFVVHQSPSSNRESTRTHTNLEPVIRVHSWFIRALVPTANQRECTRIRTPYSLPFVVHQSPSPNRESTRMHTNQNPLFASIRVHSWFYQSLSPNHESTRMHTNQNPLFASIRVHSWFIKALVPTANQRECTRIRTPYSLPFVVHQSPSPNRESTRMHTNSNPLFASIRGSSEP
jgi:hypothetical protein